MLPQYVEEHITPGEAMELGCGDKIVFIDPRPPELRDSIGREMDKRVLTVESATRSGIKTQEKPGVSFILRCFHMIKTEPEFSEDDFNAVFA